MENSFFAGLESFMEDDKTSDLVDVNSVNPEDQVASETESEEIAADSAELSSEIDQSEEKAEMVFAKFEELDRMVAYIESNGIDRPFLTLCNHNDVLTRSFGIDLPACESFDIQGDPYSNASIVALEGLREAGRKVWEFIKQLLRRCIDFIVRMIKLIPIRLALLKRKVKKLRESKPADYVGTADGDGDVVIAEALWGAIVINADAMETKDGVMSMFRPKRTPLKGCTYESAMKIVAKVDGCIKGLEDYLKHLGEYQKDVAKLNVEAARYERENNSEAAKTTKEKSKDILRRINNTNIMFSTYCSWLSSALKDAAKILKSIKKSAKE